MLIESEESTSSRGVGRSIVRRPSEITPPTLPNAAVWGHALARRGAFAPGADAKPPPPTDPDPTSAARRPPPIDYVQTCCAM